MMWHIDVLKTMTLEEFKAAMEAYAGYLTEDAAIIADKHERGEDSA